MRIVVAECTVDYEGRLAAHLPMATRLVMVKADGCVAVHADGGAYKPLNWMNAPNHLLDEGDRWVVTNPKGERLTITFGAVEFDHSLDLGDDPGLTKDGVEADLQRLLAEHPGAIEDGHDPHPAGVPDTDRAGRPAVPGDGRSTVAVEVKRRGEIDGVEQLTRYVDFLDRDRRLAPVRGLLCAQLVKPQARKLAEDRGIGWVEVDYDALRGVDSPALRLF